MNVEPVSFDDALRMAEHYFTMEPCSRGRAFYVRKSTGEAGFVFIFRGLSGGLEWREHTLEECHGERERPTLEEARSMAARILWSGDYGASLRGLSIPVRGSFVPCFSFSIPPEWSTIPEHKPVSERPSYGPEANEMAYAEGSWLSEAFWSGDALRYLPSNTETNAPTVAESSKPARSLLSAWPSVRTCSFCVRPYSWTDCATGREGESSTMALYARARSASTSGPGMFIPWAEMPKRIRIVRPKSERLEA
jgi:hypothetical protein